jgi:hypothetical protein
MTITTWFRRLKYLSPLYREPSYLPPVSKTDAQKRFSPQRVFRSARRAIPARSFQPWAQPSAPKIRPSPSAALIPRSIC